MKYIGRCGCRVQTLSDGNLKIALCHNHLPAPAMCTVHPETGLRCPRCFAASGGRVRSERKRIAVTKNSKLPRPGARHPRARLEVAV